MIDTNSWELPEIFKWLKNEGNISWHDMYRIFNCGIGMVLFIDKKDKNKAIKIISDFNMKATVIGTVKEKSTNDSVIYI